MVAGLVASAMAGESADGPFRLVELVGEADLTSRQLKDVINAEVAGGPALLVVDMSRPDVHGRGGAAGHPGRLEAAARGGRRRGTCQPVGPGPADPGADGRGRAGRRLRHRPGGGCGVVLPVRITGPRGGASGGPASERVDRPRRCQAHGHRRGSGRLTTPGDPRPCFRNLDGSSRIAARTACPATSGQRHQEIETKQELAGVPVPLP